MTTGNTNFIPAGKNDGFAGSGFSINGSRADLYAEVALFAGFNTDLMGHTVRVRLCFKLADTGCWILDTG